VKIYLYKVDSKFQPDHQDYVWPPQNQRPGNDRGVEQDFYEWSILQDDLMTEDLGEADYIYLPVFWNRFYINTPDADGHWGGGVDELNEQVSEVLKYGIPVFTISEADEFVLHPQINWGDMIMFISSRRGERGIDIPLLSAPHDVSEMTEKKYLASFVGSLGTDGTRMAMQEELINRKDCHVEHGNNGSEYFVNLMLSSYISLCPRGAGGQSFRFYEAMQLGVVPLYISDIDCRPFSKWIDWDICSLYINDANGLNKCLDTLDKHKKTLLHMGKMAKRTYDDYLCYGKWCKFVIKELELL
jgi:hypothetical protein